MSNRYIPQPTDLSQYNLRSLGIFNNRRQRFIKTHKAIAAGAPLELSQLRAYEDCLESMKKAIYDMSEAEYDQFLTECLCVAEWRIDHAKA
ncbi:MULTISPECIES: hypothetical protein [Enterobacter cloacae complex]|uniref:hypothetical protein n=1 Tax=Enterobacter cloacae complex TaxID=354276 RepID=UPI003459D964